MSHIQPSVWERTGNATPIREVDQKLCEACRNGDVKSAEESLNLKANPNVQFRLALGEQTPLFLCATKGHIDIAKLLIKHGADFKKKMDFDWTNCLHHAASNGQAEMCLFLVESGCDPNEKDRLDRTALMDGAEIGHIKVIDVLLQKGADVDQVDKEGHTALSYCIDFINRNDPRFFDAAIFLVRKGANPNYLGKFANRTILHCAAAHGDLTLVKELVETYNANPSITDSDDKTPATYAEDHGHTAIVEYLRQKEAERHEPCCIVL